MLDRGTIVRLIYLDFLSSSEIYCHINSLGEATRLEFVFKIVDFDIVFFPFAEYFEVVVLMNS